MSTFFATATLSLDRIALPPGRRWVWNCFWGLAVPWLCTLVNWPLRFRIDPANLLMIYLLGVFLVAIRFGRGASILASLQSAGAFAFLFAPPLFSFAVSDTQHLVGLSVMLFVAVVTSSLMEALRSQAAIAAEGERRASALYRLSKELADTRQETDVIAAGIRQIRAEFNCANTLLLPDSQGRLQPFGEAPLPFGLSGAEFGVAQRVFQQGQALETGRSVRAEFSRLYWPLTGSEGCLGVWILATSASPRYRAGEERILLDTFLHQIAQSLERVRATEQARCTAIRMETETLRNSLLSAISHDLRTPLSTLVGASGILAEDDGRLEAGQRQALLRTIHEDAQRMSDLTHKILDMARLEAGPVALNRQWYALEELIGSALRRMTRRLGHRPVNVDLADGLTLVFVDAVLMQQVLVNLLENAVKYAPDGPIDITARLSPTLLILAIADRGPGIPAGFEQRIFDKFFRIHPEAAKSGAGLGLSIARAVMRAHGGEIHAEARLGGGAVFRLELPLTGSPPSIEPEAEEPPCQP